MGNDIRNEGMWDKIDSSRDSMKCPEFSATMSQSDQQKGLPQPPLCKGAVGEIIEIPANFENVISHGLYTDLLDIRRTERVYDAGKPMSLDQLAFLLWSTQGIQEIRGDNYATLRPVPSGGARHSFEIYIIAQNVDGLEPGIYHYLPLEHVGEKRVAIEFIDKIPNEKESVADMLAGQKWTAAAPVILVLSFVAYRSEWRYVSMAHRVALIDLGHVGQNIMLSASAMGLGSCCLAAYDQKLCDEALGLDGYEEYTVYACTVGSGKN